MAEGLKTYYDLADNDYQFLMAAYEQGMVGNAMGAMAQEIREKSGGCVYQAKGRGSK